MWLATAISYLITAYLVYVGICQFAIQGSAAAIGNFGSLVIDLAQANMASLSAQIPWLLPERISLEAFFLVTFGSIAAGFLAMLIGLAVSTYTDEMKRSAKYHEVMAERRQQQQQQQKTSCAGAVAQEADQAMPELIKYN